MGVIMKHLFVPYELALLAKEKGFNEFCSAHYQKEFSGKFVNDGVIISSQAVKYNNVKGANSEYYAAPELLEALISIQQSLDRNRYLNEMVSEFDPNLFDVISEAINKATK